MWRDDVWSQEIFVTFAVGRYKARPSSFRASPAPRRLASFISEYLRESITPSAPPWNAASTACLVPSGELFELVTAVGISISMPGQRRVLVPARPALARFVSRNT